MKTRTAFILPAALLFAAWAGPAAGGPALEDLRAESSSQPGAVPVVQVPAPPAPQKAADRPPELTRAEELLAIEARVSFLQAALTNLPGDLGRLEQDIFRVRELGPAFIRSSLAGLAADMRKYAADSRSLSSELQKFKNGGEKSKKLDAAASELYSKARRLSEESRYHVQPAMEKVVWAMHSVKAETIGTETVWDAVEMASQAAELNWNARDILEYSGNLWVQVYPGPGQAAASADKGK